MGEGIIIKALSGYYYVQDGERLVTCRARGKLRLDKSSPLVGDRVSYEPTPEGGGYVLKIQPRRNWFVRPAVANIDVMVIVAAAVNPISEPYLLDRMTSLAEKHGCIFVDFQAMYDRYFQHRHSCCIAWDRIHPNQIGATLMAREFLKHCDFDYNR